MINNIINNNDIFLLSDLFPKEALDNLDKDIKKFFISHNIEYVQEKCEDQIIQILSPLNDNSLFNSIEMNKVMFFELYYLFIQNLFPNEYKKLTSKENLDKYPDITQIIKFLSKLLFIMIDKKIYMKFLNVYSALFNILSIYCVCNDNIAIYSQFFDCFIESKTWDKISIYLTQSEYNNDTTEEDKNLYSVILQKAIFVIYNGPAYYELLFKHSNQLLDFIADQEIILEPLGVLIIFIIEIALSNDFYSFLPATIDQKVESFKTIFEEQYNHENHLSNAKYLSFLLCLQLKVNSLREQQ